jgi:hypothetical protein
MLQLIHYPFEEILCRIQDLEALLLKIGFALGEKFFPKHAGRFRFLGRDQEARQRNNVDFFLTRIWHQVVTFLQGESCSTLDARNRCPH